MPNASFADLVGTLRNFQESRVLLAALELDIFSAVGEGASGAEAAARAGTDPRATEMLLNALVAVGALEKREGLFRNTLEAGRFLVMGSAETERPALLHMVSVWKSWTTLVDAVRAGTAVRTPGVEGRDQEWTGSFIAAMHARARGTAADLVRAVGAAGVRRVLDVGGGSGAFAIAFAQADAAIEAEVFDKAEVVPIAERHIAEAGVGARVRTRVGDLTRDELGSGYDLVLLSAICHMLGPEENLDLLRRGWRALAAGGRVAIRDFILEPDKTAPKQAALFALNMLVGTRRGATYTEAEYRGWLEQAGFGEVRRLEPAGDLIVALRK